MDYPVQELSFLDLSDTDEDERDFLHATLFTRNPSLSYPELPWMAHPDVMCTTAEWRPPYASGESVEGPPVSVAVEEGDCNSSAVQNTPPQAGQEVMPQEPHAVAATGAHTTPVYAPDTTTVLPVPPQIPTSVPAPAQPSAMTAMYHIPGVAVPNVYVGNVTANVNVHGYVSNPYYQHIPQQQIYTGEVAHESAPPSVRNGGRDSRRGGRSKPSNKRMDGQFVDRSSAGRHNQEVIPTQAPLVDSPPTGNTTIPPQSYPPMFSLNHLHHSYPASFYNPATPAPHAHHLTHHPSAQHAAGTPIYLSSPTMYAPPTLYNPYPPPPQPGAPPMLPFPAAMQPVPTTETSVLGGYQVESNGTEERIPGPTTTVVGKGTELNEMNIHRQHHQKQAPSQPVTYSSEPVQEVCQSSEVVASGQDSAANTTVYQQQQSEEDDYSQTNLVNTVVVNNSNIVAEPIPFSDVKETEVKSMSLPPLSGHQNFSKDSVSPKYVPEKRVSSSDVKVDESVSVQQDSRASVSDTSASVNKAVSDVDLKKDKAVSTGPLPSAVSQQDKSHVDIKSSVPHVDAPATEVTTPKPVQAQCMDSTVASLTNNPQPASTSSSVSVQQQTSGQNATPVASVSHVTEVSSTQGPVATTPNLKSWASLFKPPSSGDAGNFPAVGGASGNTKPFACVKPFQNAVTVSSASSRTAVQHSPASPLSSNTSNVKSFPHHPSDSIQDPHLYRLGEFLSKYQLEHKTLSLQPRGLTNRSNWCYINSTLQALLACPPFYNLMKAMSGPLSSRSGKSTTPIIDNMVKFVSEFAPLSAASRPKDRKEKAVRKDDGSIEDQCGPPFEPSYIYKMLNNIRSDTFKVEGRQEDAEEFLSCLLNALNDEMLELIKLVGEPTTRSSLSNGDIATNGDTSAQSQDEDELEWKVMGPKNKGSITRQADFGRTPISDIFRGQLRSRLQREGQQCTDNVQPFFTLQLDIEKVESVKDALDRFVGQYQLEGLTCSRTNKEVEAWQQVNLEELPPVLLLHLKWFDYKMDGASKIIKSVEFPIDLKIDPKMLANNKKYISKQRQYKLFAVVYHDGKEATKGHYVTDVYHVGYGGWVRYDDSVVKAVQESAVLRPTVPRVPYLLYYRRCDTIGSTQPPSVPDKSR